MLLVAVARSFPMETRRPDADTLMAWIDWERIPMDFCKLVETAFTGATHSGRTACRISRTGPAVGVAEVMKSISWMTVV